MMRLRKVAKLLDAAIKEEGSAYLSIWSKKRYLDLFEYGPEGIGQIKRAEITSRFSFPQDASPKDVEQMLCAEFEIYEQSGFFKRLWWYITRPVELYRKVYALTHLRDLKAGLLINKPLDRESTDINKAFSSFLSLLKPLADYFNSFLPSFDSLNTIIRGQSQSVHKKMLEVFMKLKIEMESDYTGHLLRLMSQKNNNKLQENNLQWVEIEQWKATLKESLALKVDDNSLNLRYREELKALEVKLDSMYSVLSSVNNYKYNPQINAFPISLNKASDNKLVSHTYPGPFQKIEHDCVVAINEGIDYKLRAKNDTYHLTFHKGQWILCYSDKAINKDVEMRLEQVDNLINLCTTEVLDNDAIEQCIFAYHATRVSADKKDNPNKRYLRALDTSLEKQVSKQLCEYSLKIVAKQIEVNKQEDSQAIIENLMHHSAAMHEENEPYINAYLAMCTRLELQKNHYETVTHLIETQSLAFQKAALRYAFENQHINADTLQTHLETVILPEHISLAILSFSQDYNVLGVVAKKQTQSYLEKENKTNLEWISKIKKTSKAKLGFFSFLRSPTSPLHEKIKEELNDLTDKSSQLPEAEFHTHLKEKALALMERVLRTEVYDSYSHILAFTEIKTQQQMCIEQFRSQLKSQSSSQKPQQSTSNASIKIALTIPMPTEDSESAWASWLSQVMRNPNTLGVAMKALETHVRETKAHWAIDLLRYNILIQLAVHWVEAITWRAISINGDHQEVSEQVIDILRSTNKLFAIRYHPDKNRGVDAEAMKSFNSCRDEGIKQIKLSLDSTTPPFWITSLLEKKPNLIKDNFHRDMNDRFREQSRYFEEAEKQNAQRKRRFEEMGAALNQLQKNVDAIEAILLKRKQAEEDQRVINHSTNKQGLFAENKKTFNPQPRFPVTTLSSQHQQLLSDNHWEITQLPGEGCDFFTALASEIIKIKQTPEYEELTKARLRHDCYSFYSYNNNKKKTTASLNKAFKEMNENAFQVDRTENYHLIRFHNDKNNMGNPIITGVCCVEGVILCTTYKLPAICEMTLGQDNAIHYAYATREGYKTCSEAEFNQHTKDSPVLLKNEGNYYFASKIQLKEEVTEDFLPVSEENPVSVKLKRKPIVNHSTEPDTFTL